jgi:hypothetical protein
LQVLTARWQAQLPRARPRQETSAAQVGVDA